MLGIKIYSQFICFLSFIVHYVSGPTTKSGDDSDTKIPLLFEVTARRGNEQYVKNASAEIHHNGQQNTVEKQQQIEEVCI